ncbi:flagellar hook-basal body complex protein FliE [Undibacterium squillarum]|jgi:flagellar hook-basal body complex protein FliE|uniref:flagellar hook-basal body complex protein FliE n=1 Tax=Undibacterium squillarum TaxID=1131567 RepID=UPI0035B2FE6D
MSINGIDRSQITAMMAQIRAAAAKMEGVQAPVRNTITPAEAPKIDFAEALKASLDQVNSAQSASKKLGEQFALGDDKVSLSDVMISAQKASISFQTTVQVRNKLVSAYHDIMNMQI